MTVSWLPRADGASPWPQAHVVVAGIGVSGFAAADGLLEFGARVTVLDDRSDAANSDKATLLETLGGTVRLGPGATATLPPDADLVITTGWPASAPLLAQAAARGVPIWSEVELAWRLSRPDRAVPWLGITGTNGKTTTTSMLAAMLSAAGLRTAAVGNIGRPVTETVLDREPYDVLAVELSSHQLHWSHSLALHSAAVLNVQPDHLEWHGSYAAYADSKATIYAGVSTSCVYNVADPETERMVEEAEVVEGARAIGFTLGTPGPSMLGLVDDLLVDRAFIPQRRDSALELAGLADVPGAAPGQPPAPHLVANALAAAALARSYGVPATAVRDGLRATTLGGHKIQLVAELAGVRWVDDSKATNPHAADAALRAYGQGAEARTEAGLIVWIAGGQAKGTTFDDLVATHAKRLRGAVLLGVDRDVIAEALARHAPEVPVTTIVATDTGAMAQAVAAADQLARPGDAVLLAPGCASRDMYPDYAARGEAFAAAVRELGRGGTADEHGPDPRPDPATSGPAAPPTTSATELAAWLRGVLDRPLTSYHLVLGSVALLLVVGVMMVLSASSVNAYVTQGDSYHFVKRQLLFLGMGAVGAVVLMKLPVPTLRGLGWVAVGLAAVLLILTYTPVGVTVNGNRNWLELGSSTFRIQPAEFAKLAMIVWGADVLARKQRLLDQPRHLLVPFLPVSGLLILLVVFQGDAGTAVVMAGIVAGMLWVVGAPWPVLGGLAAAGAAGVAAMFVTSPVRMRRLAAFLDPNLNSGGINDQASSGLYAIASGGWWGVGLGASRQKWGSLPEAHTDFIFAVLGEEFGLLGSLMVLVLFGVLAYAGVRIAVRSDDPFARYAAGGVTVWFAVQSLFNLAVVLRLLPVARVPLPMVSYGGSALLANLLAVGVLLGCARREPDARRMLARRSRRPVSRMTTVTGSRAPAGRPRR